MYLKVMGLRVIFGVVGLFLAAASAAQTPYIATSANYFCAGGSTPITLYGNVSVWDPGTDPATWNYAWSPPELFADPSTQLVELLPDATLTLTLTMVSPAGQVFVDDITITVIPLLLGSGRSLFGPLQQDIHLTLESSRAYAFGFVQNTYVVHRERKESFDRATPSSNRPARP